MTMLRKPALAASIGAFALLGGCGGSHAPVKSTAKVPSAAQPSTATTGEPVTATTPTTTAQATNTTPSSEPSRSGGEPAFVEPSHPTGGEGLAGAENALREHGYTAVETGAYKPQETLRVLVGKGAGGELAFFFIGNRYIGTDSKTASTQVVVAAQHEGSVTLRYTLYSGGHPNGSATVTFNLENGSLQAQEPIPPAARRTAG